MYLEIILMSVNGEDVRSIILKRKSEEEDILEHCIIGSFDSLENGEPDWSSFKKNRAFIEFYENFMKGEELIKPQVLDDAEVSIGENVVIIDGRTERPDDMIPPFDVIGAYQSKDGRPIADSFKYNFERHKLILADGKMSSILSEVDFLKSIYEPIHGLGSFEEDFEE